MSWWNDNYLFRRNIQLDILDPIPTNHPVTCVISSSILILLNKVRNDLADVVIVYYDNSADIWTPLPTDASIVGDEVEISFNTYMPVNVTNNTNYYIYYGNKNLIDAPTLASLITNAWPLETSYLSNKVTYKHPDIDWTNGVSTTTGAKAAFVFSGTAVRPILEYGLDDGIVSLQLDNESMIYIDLYQTGSPIFKPIDVPEYTDLNADYHTLRVINTGRHNNSALASQVAINSFQYLGYIKAIDLGEEIQSLNWTASTGGTT